MKAIKYLVVLLILLTITTGCGKQKKPDLTAESIKSIAELSTLDVYYHNVATGDKPKGTNIITSIGEVPRKYWIEYDGVVNIGTDMKEMEISIDGSKVIITMPKAKILSTNIISDMKIYSSDDNWFNKNKITADDQTVAVATAQTEMMTKAQNNKSLFEQANQRAETIITSYINQISKLSCKDYTVEFKYK